MTSGTDMARRRREILAAAQEAFDASGYAATTVEEVAAKAGISKGSIYNYFRNKQDLFEHVFSEFLAPDEAEVDRMLAQPRSAAEKMLGYLDYCFEQMARFCRIGKLVLEFWTAAAREPQHANLAWSLHEMYDRTLERVRSIVAEGIETGEFRPGLDPRTAAAVILAAVDGTIVHAIVLGWEFDQVFVRTFTDSLMAALRPQPPLLTEAKEVTSHE